MGNKKIERVLLVYPNQRWLKDDAVTTWDLTPYTICMLATVIKDLVEVKVVDAQLEKYSEEDKKRKELAELHNKADAFVYSTEKSLKDYGDKVSSDEKKNIEEKLAALKELLKKSDATKEEIEKSLEELTKVSHKLAEEVYKATAAKQQAEHAQASMQ